MQRGHMVGGCLREHRLTLLLPLRFRVSWPAFGRIVMRVPGLVFPVFLVAGHSGRSKMGTVPSGRARGP